VFYWFVIARQSERTPGVRAGTDNLLCNKSPVPHQDGFHQICMTVLLLFYSLQLCCLIKNCVLSKVPDNTTIQGPAYHKRFFILQICASTILLLLMSGNKNI